MKKIYYCAMAFLLFLNVSCVSEKIESDEDRTSYNKEAIWEYNGEIATLNKVIEELKSGPDREKLERRLLKNDVLWEEAKFLLIDNKKRIIVPFLSTDRENVTGVLALVKDAKGKTTFDMTVRSRLNTKDNKLPFWNPGIWLGYFMALDKDILGIKNGNPGFKQTVTISNNLRLKATAQNVCDLYLITTTHCSYAYWISNSGETYNYVDNGCTDTYTYEYNCYWVPDPPTPITDPNPGTGSDGDSGGGGMSTINIPTFNLTQKITNLKKELQCFDQNTGAKLTLYADQSITGSRELTADIGHTFIGITQNGITRSLGFYPDSPHAALMSSQTSEIHNNSNSFFDVSITINISANQLTNIINYITNYPSTYDLNNFNCTDFGIKVMNLGGLTLPKTIGTYGFLFKGHNPSDLAEDMRALQLPIGASRDLNSGNAPAKSGTCN